MFPVIWSKRACQEAKALLSAPAAGNVPECGGNIWLAFCGDDFDFDKLVEIVDEDVLHAGVGTAEKVASTRREFGLKTESLASKKKEECEAIKVTTVLVVNEMTLRQWSAMKDSHASSTVLWNVESRLKAEDL